MPRGEKTKLLWRDKNYRESMIQKHRNGKRQTIEYRQLQSEKGKQYFENHEIKKAQSERIKQLWQNPEYRKHMIEAHKGYMHSEEQRKKIGESNRKYAIKPCIICGKEIRKGLKFRKYCSKECFGIDRRGFKCSEETLQKMRNIERLKGIYHPNWQGGKSFEPYPLGWTKTFKEQIRYRDKYTCQLCGVPEVECNRKLAVHHIDYNKDNLSENNLISLCQSCHQKTNFNKDYWEGYFNERKWQIRCKIG